ncbi:MAG: glycosyltransferase [Candidatus Krumholzibacteriia bacterium]
MKTISVIYVSYNSGEEILASVKSLREAGSRHALEVIAVDNASRDDSAARLAEAPHLTLLQNPMNLGYARAVNLGLTAATGDYVLVLNPDVTVRPGAVDALVEFMDAHPRAGIAGAKLLNEDGTLQHSCRSFYTFWTVLLRRTPLGKLFPKSRALRHHLMLDFDHASERAVDWVLGACMMVRRQAVAEVGPMDPRFFLYFEDVDWCYRMQTRGWEVWYVPGAVMNHVHKRASARNPFSRSLVAHITSFVHYTEKWNPAAYLLKRYRNLFKVLTLLVLDVAGAGAAYLAAIALRRSFHLDYFIAEPYQRFALLYFVIVLGTYYLSGLYRSSRRESASEELLALGKAGVLAGVVLMSSTFLSKERIVSRAVVLASVLIAVLLTWLLRGGLRALHRVLLRYHFDLRRLLLVGTAVEASALEQRLLRHPELGLEMVGRIAVGESEMERRGALGGPADLERVSAAERVQEIVVAPSGAGLPSLATALIWCRARSIDLRLLSDLAGMVGRGARAEDFLGLPAVAYRMAGLYPLERAFKRLADLVVGLAGLVLTLLPGLVHLGVSRGARRLRVEVLGRHGRPTRLTLVLRRDGRPAPDVLNPWAFAAVLAGGLSLVGPMPRRALPAPPPDLGALLTLRPGLTGAWRRRGRVDAADEARQLDLFYLRNWSLGLDLQLWLETLGAQLRGDHPAFLLARLRGEEATRPTAAAAPGEKGLA